MVAEQPAKDPGLSWSQLRAFEASARLLSFNAAAASLNLTPAAIRHQVGLLEARLGARLYERRGGRLALTKPGAAFRGRIARPMQELAKACAEASQSASTAPLLLTAPPMFARQYLFGDRFLKWCDSNFIRLEVTDSMRDLTGPDQIVAVRLGAEPAPDISLTPVLAVKLTLAAAPRIAVDAGERLVRFAGTLVGHIRGGLVSSSSTGRGDRAGRGESAMCDPISNVVLCLEAESRVSQCAA
jgi:LysR family glycine cleavage system transcriptional activator